MPETISAERVREILDYDPATGIFRWKVTRPKGGVKAGDVAGCLCKTWGYILIRISGSLPGEKPFNYRAHRLAWLYVHGHYPPKEIDHRNLARADNRLSNLRLAEPGENLANRPKPKHNTSGYKGVVRNGKSQRNPWRAQIAVKRKWINLGVFDDPGKGHAAYVAAAIKYYGEFARGE